MEPEKFIMLCVDIHGDNKTSVVTINASMPLEDNFLNMAYLKARAKDICRQEAVCEPYILRVKSYERLIPTTKGFATMSDD